MQRGRGRAEFWISQKKREAREDELKKEKSRKRKPEENIVLERGRKQG